MPYIPHTPEALLPRSDSKNPNATCRGITSNGRPCRRAIAGSLALSKTGFLSSRPAASPRGPDAYCWQHKDQAELGTTASPQGLQGTTIIERNSIDTLAERLGLLEVQENQKPSIPPRPKPAHQSHWHHAQTSAGPPASPSRPAQRPNPKPKSKLGFFCCVIGEIEDHTRPARPYRKPHHVQEKPISTQPRPHPSPQTPSRQQKSNSQLSLSPNHGNSPSPRRPSTSSQLQLSPTTTARYLSLIPSSTTPESTSLLLSELAKPPSLSDEPGYIYMFWLTPTTLPTPPPRSATSKLLSVPHRPGGPGRSTSDVLKTFSQAKENGNKKTILLKIGRASNVQRRLNEWSRQCGYDLSLIRYYPYHSSNSPSGSPRSERAPHLPPATPRKVPHAHKVERLIHLELAGKGLRASGAGGGDEKNAKCSSCGREHREWFEVEATRKGVGDVDEVVRRWVEWGMHDE